MSVSIANRRQACLHFIQNGFDVDKTVKWFLLEYATDPTVQRVKHPERLAANIITMGGDGIQQDINANAFKLALDDYQAELREREAALNRQKIAGLEADLRKAYDQRDAAQVEANRLHARVDTLSEQLRSSERAQFALAEPVAA